MKRLYIYGIVLALAFGTATYHKNVPFTAQLLAALIVCGITWGVLTGQQRLQVYRDRTKLTRAWARAMFARGFMSMEELQQFYDTHPEKENLGN